MQILTSVGTDTNDNVSLGSANNDVNLLKDDFIFMSNQKYCTQRKKHSTIINSQDSSSADNTKNEEYTSEFSE